MESKIQNKLAIIAIFTGVYVGLFTLFSTISLKDPITEAIVLVVLGAGLIPLFHFFLYLLFLPLRYKSQKKNIFSIEFHDYRIDEINVDKLFDKGANWLIPTFVGGFSYYISLKLAMMIFKDYNFFQTLLFMAGGYYLSTIFISKVIRADKVDKDYKFGDGFISLFKRIRKKSLKDSTNNSF